MAKITRSRNGCITCKQRRRKCDETKPACLNCINSGRKCGGYEVRLVFDVDDSRNSQRKYTVDANGKKKFGFRGRPRVHHETAENPDDHHHDHHQHQQQYLQNGHIVHALTAVVTDGPVKKERPASPISVQMDRLCSSIENGSSQSQTNQTSHPQNRTLGEIKVKKEPPEIQHMTQMAPVTSSSSSAFSTPLGSMVVDENTQGASTNSSRSDVDITDPFQFENALYDGLDYLLSNSEDMNMLNDASAPFAFASGPSLQEQEQQLQQQQQRQQQRQQREDEERRRAAQMQAEANEHVQTHSQAEKQMTTALAAAGASAGQQGNLPQTFFEFIKSPTPRVATPRMMNPIPSPEAIPHVQTISSADEMRIMSVPDNTSEDNFILRHFFEKVIYLLDAHPKTPWPELMIRFCSFELARSCFLSLSSIHLFLDNGENEFYKKGVLHINNTMEYLMKYVRSKDGSKKIKQSAPSPSASSGSSNSHSSHKDSEGGSGDNSLNVERIVENLKHESTKRKQTNFFVILLLLYVHLLFAVLESGRSALLRMFFKLFASIASDDTFKRYLKHIDQSQALICVLSWFDTITALVSPDCRLPYSRPEWYGTRTDNISTAKMNGCPGEIFGILGEICKLRHHLGGNRDAENAISMNEMELNYNFEKLKNSLINYREYVPLKLSNSFPYENRLKAAQCWSMAALVKLLEVCKPPGWRESMDGLILEFLSVYESLDPHSPIVTQMVWPVLNIGVHSRTAESRVKIMKFQETLYRTVRMGTAETIMRVTKESWNTGKTLDEILSEREWHGSGIDFIPC